MPHSRPTRLRYFVGLFVLVPVGLAVIPGENGHFIALAIVICFAAPVGGFWWGEMKGESGEGRAVLGCLGTLALFAVLIAWGFFLAPRLFQH